MKEFEIKIAKVVYRTRDEFKTEEEASIWAANMRDKLSEIEDNKLVEYFHEVEEIDNV
jgi:uncharacterized lipoprotein YmbA